MKQRTYDNEQIPTGVKYTNLISYDNKYWYIHWHVARGPISRINSC